MVATVQKHTATHTHAINTAGYGIVLARIMQLGPPEAIRDVARGGLLHDIGKNRVPLVLLDKPAAFDALTTRRPYRTGATAFDALHLMRVAMRGQFSDELLREFIQLLGGFKGMKAGLADPGVSEVLGAAG